MSNNPKAAKSWAIYIMEAAAFASSVCATYYLLKHLLSNLDPTKTRQEKRNMAPDLENRLKSNGWTTVMDEHEAAMLEHITFPEQIDVEMEDIGGCEEIKDAIEEIFIFPTKYPEIYEAKSLLRAPKGMLFFGPPGTGKTMMAKAVCKFSGSTFFNIRMSAIQSKWFGESVRYVRALFSLANKLAPSVIFIDEVDAFMQARGLAHNNDVSLGIKAEFMSLWDGLISDPSSRVIVLGATNRPRDIDKAFLRRMPRQFEFSIPNKKARIQILKILLKDSKLDEKDGVSPEQLAEVTRGYSGSDLLEMCKTAAMIPLKEFIISQKMANRKQATPATAEADKKDNTTAQATTRPLNWSDFQTAMNKVKPTGYAARSYAARRAASELNINHTQNNDDDASLYDDS